MGNKLGWLLAGGLVVVVAIAVLIAVGLRSGISRPTRATAGSVLALQQVQMPLADITGFTPNQPGNAADDYQRALQLTKAAMDRLAAAIHRTDPRQFSATDRETLEQIHQAVRAGVRKQDFSWPLGPFRMEYEYAPALDLMNVSGALTALGRHYLATDRHDDARDVYMNQLAMGRHVSQDRSRAYLVAAGLGIQREALRGLGEVYQARGGSRDMLDRIELYNVQVGRVSNAYRQKMPVVWQISNLQAGDIFHIIDRDEDPAWRVEALLSLGILKFTQEGHKANNNHIRRLLERYAGDPDPALARAAQTAAATTREQLFTEYKISIP